MNWLKRAPDDPGKWVRRTASIYTWQTHNVRRNDGILEIWWGNGQGQGWIPIWKNLDKIEHFYWLWPQPPTPPTD